MPTLGLMSDIVSAFFGMSCILGKLLLLCVNEAVS